MKSIPLHYLPFVTSLQCLENSRSFDKLSYTFAASPFILLLCVSSGLCGLLGLFLGCGSVALRLCVNLRF
jgi:hypothetical protein